MSLKKIDLKDRPLFDSFLEKERRENSAYAFTNIFIWKSLFNIYRCEIEGSLVVIFEDNSGRFLYLPPLGGDKKAAAARKAFRIMEEHNGKGSPVTRIENIAFEDVGLYRKAGFECSEVSCDYLFLRDSIASYRGDKFKHKRSARNHFEKNYKFDYLPFSSKNACECLSLYDVWAEERSKKRDDRIYRSFLEDSRKALGVLLESYSGLDVTGRAIKIDGKIKAFTFGYRLSDETFVVLYEVADLSFKGITQYIFSRFASELAHKHLNIMGDSDLENLREAKLSFHPEKTVPIYMAVKPIR